MATLNYNGNEYNILYIDANIGANEGDGSTPATALANIPSPLVDKTCYIIRRNADDETIHVDLPQSWYDSLYYIMFLGMPLADDPMYNIMETSVKSLWGSDTGKYARIRCNMADYYQNNNYVDSMANTNNKTLFKTNSVRNFYSANCYFYRDGNGGSAGDGYHGIDYIFGFDYGSRFADISFNNCKFGYTQYNLENDDYITNSNDISTDASKYPQNKCCSYIGVSNANSITFNNCVINHVWYNVNGYYRNYWSSGCSKVIAVYNTNKLIYTGCQYNILYRNSYNNTSTSYQEYVYNLYASLDRGKIYFKDIEINKIYTRSNARIANRCINFWAYDIKVDNVRINQKIMGGGTLSGWTSLINDSKYIVIDGRNSIQFKNLYCDLSSSNLKMAPILGIYSQKRPMGNPNSKIENIYIHMDDNGSFSQGDACFHFENYIGHWNNSGEMSNVGSNSSWDTSYEGTQPANVKSYLADNVVIYSKNDTGYALYCIRTNVKSPHIEGRVYLGSSILDIKKHYINISTSNAAVIEGNSYYKCDDFEANLEYPGYSGGYLISWQPQSKSSVYINKSNCILFNETPYTSIYAASSNNSFVCPNYIKTGQFFQRNEVCFAKSWNTVRTGSNSQGSLRFNNNYAGINNNSHPLIVGHEPYAGIQIVPGSTGKKILTAYMATKNLDASETGYTGRIGIHVICPEKYTDYYNVEKTNLRHHEWTSEAIGWQSDNSTWSGDTNLRTYKCEIPIQVYTLDEPIDVKIWFNWYSVNGYLYVDPDFKLTDVL